MHEWLVVVRQGSRAAMGQAVMRDHKLVLLGALRISYLLAGKI